MEITTTDRSEIVAVMFNTAGRTITTDKERMVELLKKGYAPIDLLDRARAKGMAAADLGIRWERLAEAPTLFLKGSDRLKIRLFKTTPGEIGETPAWAAISSEYLYIADTLPGLVRQVVEEWEWDRHLVG